MNYRGSYRKLLGNSRAAMMAAIEIYNKPLFQYRDECMVILLLNAWELSLKALLSLKKQSIYYPKKRNQPYRTLSWQDALAKARRFFPESVPFSPTQRNLELLGTYRDNAVHFYNATDFGLVLYALAQTSITNYRDLLDEVFNVRIEEQINWQLLPLGIRPPVDVVRYISDIEDTAKTGAVRQFLSELARATKDLIEAGEDTGRLLTVFDVELKSVKKIGDADVVVGVTKAEGFEGPLAVVRTQDPNVTHPLRRKEILDKISSLHGQPFTAYIFDAIAWKLELRNRPQYCWRATEGVLTRYSNDTVQLIERLSVSDVESAVRDYRAHMRARASKRRR